ncbi:PCI-domain-containing protein [Flagelloscypha sp. PMI_526]|nr:PCI-domain-containing protein [Flagelloscypha sp. PMI_526]
MSLDSDNPQPLPNLLAAQSVFVLSQPSLSKLHSDALKEFKELVTADEMGPYYALVQSSFTAPNPALGVLSKSEVDSIEKANKEELDKVDERIKEAQETEGESELSDALRTKAFYYTKIGAKSEATAALKEALEKTPGGGGRIDVVLTLVRLGLFFGDNKMEEEWLAKAEELIEEGGDWDRRNRLKVYQGIHYLTIRQFSKASELLLAALPTFTATELLSFNDFVTLTVISSALVLSRVDVKKKIISSPEILSVIPDVPIIGDLVNTLYESRYADFFHALATLSQSHLQTSRLMSPHATYYVREMRIRAYTQILESYRSLTMSSLAQAFGVTEEFLDNELSKLISQNRLHAAIDSVNGVVETTRPTPKARRDAQYETLIKRGDVLLGEIGRLGRVLH